MDVDILVRQYNESKDSFDDLISNWSNYKYFQIQNIKELYFGDENIIIEEVHNGKLISTNIDSLYYVFPSPKVKVEFYTWFCNLRHFFNIDKDININKFFHKNRLVEEVVDPCIIREICGKYNIVKKGFVKFEG